MNKTVLDLKTKYNNNPDPVQVILAGLDSSGYPEFDIGDASLIKENGRRLQLSSDPSDLSTDDAIVVKKELDSGLSTKQDLIDSSHELSADLVNDSSAENKFVTQTLIDTWNNHVISKGNPHEVTKSQVGLGNVDNTSDLGKPISTATQTALDGKQDLIDSTHKLSADLIEDGTTNKVFTATEQSKLSGIEAGAEVNDVDSVNGQTGTVVLDADDISDTNTTNKFVTASEKVTWNGKVDSGTLSLSFFNDLY